MPRLNLLCGDMADWFAMTFTSPFRQICRVVPQGVEAPPSANQGKRAQNKQETAGTTKDAIRKQADVLDTDLFFHLTEIT